MKKIKGFLMLAFAAGGTLLTACDDELDVKQAYAFHLETMPVQTHIVRGETAEIHCTLVREGGGIRRRTVHDSLLPTRRQRRTPHGRWDAVPPQRPLPAHERGVSAVLHLCVVGSADYRHLCRRQLRAMRAAVIPIQQRE